MIHTFFDKFLTNPIRGLKRRAVPVALVLLTLLGSTKARAEEAGGAEGVDDPGLSTSLHYTIDGQDLDLHITWVKVEPGLEDNPEFIEAIQKFQANSGDRPITFFSEEGGRAPSSEKKARLARIQARLKAKGASTEAFKIPQSTIEKLSSHFSKFFTRPSTDAVYLGLMEAAWSGVTSGMIYFSQAGLSTPLAAALVALRTTVSGGTAIWSTSFDHLFSKSVEDVTKDVKPVTQFLRRQGFSFLLTELTRMLSGATAGAASAFTLHGQAQIFSYLLTVGSSSALYSAVAFKTFAKDPKVLKRLQIFSFMLMAPINMASLAGLMATVRLDLGFYQLADSALMVLGAYGGLAYTLHQWPEKVAALMRAPDPFLAKIRTLLGRGKLHDCNSLLNPEQQLSTQ